MEKRQGALYFDREEERYNIRFGLEECYHGLYCGEGLEVLVGKDECVSGLKGSGLVSGWD